MRVRCPDLKFNLFLIQWSFSAVYASHHGPKDIKLFEILAKI